MTQPFDEFGYPLSPLEALSALKRRPQPRLKPPEDEEEEPLDVTGIRPKIIKKAREAWLEDDLAAFKRAARKEVKFLKSLLPEVKP